MKTFILTGATSGIGLEAAKALAANPAHRIIAGVRNPKSANDLRSAVPAGQLQILDFDAASLESVRRFAAQVSSWDGLAGNAGIQTAGELERSADGHELTFAVNHLANFCLIEELLPKARSGARVVITASGTHDPADSGARRFGFRGGRLQSARALAEGLGDLTATEAQRGRDRYATSKLCALLSVYEWARRGPAEVAFLAYDPGLVPGTGLVRNRGVVTWLWKHLLPALAVLMPGASTAPVSGAALAWLLTEEKLAGRTGVQFDFQRREARSSEDSYRLDYASTLFEETRELLRIGAASASR